MKSSVASELGVAMTVVDDKGREWYDLTYFDLLDTPDGPRVKMNPKVFAEQAQNSGMGRTIQGIVDIDRRFRERYEIRSKPGCSFAMFGGVSEYSGTYATGLADVCIADRYALEYGGHDIGSIGPVADRHSEPELRGPSLKVG